MPKTRQEVEVLRITRIYADKPITLAVLAQAKEDALAVWTVLSDPTVYEHRSPATLHRMKKSVLLPKGTFRRIARDEAHCPLCSLFCNAERDWPACQECPLTYMDGAESCVDGLHPFHAWRFSRGKDPRALAAAARQIATRIKRWNIKKTYAMLKAEGGL